MQIPSDAEILKMQNVPVRVASKYLGLSLPATYFGLQQDVFPFREAIQNKGSEYTYHISPGLLVAYQRGTLRIGMKGSKCSDEDAEFEGRFYLSQKSKEFRGNT